MAKVDLQTPRDEVRPARPNELFEHFAGAP
jgi:hypothetical protein